MDAPDYSRGLYLQDGVTLWWVVRVDEVKRSVLLENSYHPSMPLVEVTVSALVLNGYKVVGEESVPAA